jgi:broad specificity phosphatase PhoE
MRHARAAPADGQDEGQRFSTDDTPLAEAGRRQARAAGAMLAEADPPPGAVHASPAKRCRETARLVAEALPGEREVRVHEDLLEVPFEPLGAPYEEVVATIEATAERLREDPDPDLPIGSSWQEATGRFARRLEAIVEARERPVVVAHGAQNRAWLADLLDMAPHRLFALAQDHACVNHVVHADGRPVLRRLNATPGRLGGERWDPAER